MVEHKDTIARGDFGEWMVNNIDKCIKVTEDLDMDVARMGDIILVTGCHLSRSWIHVTFPENQIGAQVSFRMRRCKPSEVHVGEGDVTGRDVKFGLQGKVHFDMKLGFQPMLRNCGPGASRICGTYRCKVHTSATVASHLDSAPSTTMPEIAQGCLKAVGGYGGTKERDARSMAHRFKVAR
jgi:hypothetical protein